jgi:hypothetical protein
MPANLAQPRLDCRYQIQVLMPRSGGTFPVIAFVLFTVNKKVARSRARHTMPFCHNIYTTQTNTFTFRRSSVWIMDFHGTECQVLQSTSESIGRALRELSSLSLPSGLFIVRFCRKKISFFLRESQAGISLISYSAIASLQLEQSVFGFFKYLLKDRSLFMSVIVP